MRKSLMFLMCLGFLSFLSVNSISAQSCGGGITYTSSFPWVSGPVNSGGHGMIGTTSKRNDTIRLNAILTQCTGKIIFNESEYYINGTLPVYSYRIIEGTGTGTNVTNGTLFPSLYPSSKIIQTANLPIFKIGTNIVDVSIRDLAMIGGMVNTSGNLFGIYAEGGISSIPANNGNPTQAPCSPAETGNCASLGFRFSNLQFLNLNKGFYINAANNGEWQFDHVTLDHAKFVECIIGIHVKTKNGGLNFSSLDFRVPNGAEQGEDGSIVGKTYGIYLENSTYTSMNWIVGGGPTSTGPPLATALIYVNQHHNLTIQNSIAEGFRKDIIVESTSRNYPITLTGNQFLNGVSIKDATVYSTGNHYSAPNSSGSPALAKGVSQIYSMGDKFCNEGDLGNPNANPPILPCDETRGFEIVPSYLPNNPTPYYWARNIFVTTQNGTKSAVPFLIAREVFYSSNAAQNAITQAPHLSLISPGLGFGPLLRLGVRGFNYDFSRNETDGKLDIKGNQNNYSGYSFQMTSNNAVKRVDINNDGSIKIGSVTFSELGSSTSGTMIYCADCQETNTCAGSGSGAFAKKLPNRWDCD